MPVTIKDIAKIANVSHTTVSRALKGHPAISAETTAHIRQLAQEMGYIPSAVAQSLLSQRTNTIGVVLTSIADPFTVRIVGGVEEVAQAAGYSVFLSTSHNDPQKEMAVVETLHRRRVDAIIVIASRVGSLYSARLEQLQVPIVLVNNQQEGHYLRSVAVNDEQGAQLAVDHLLGLEHKRIAYIGATDRPRSNRRRLNGYQKAMKDAGAASENNIILHPTANTDIERGQAALSLLLAAGATAVFCYNDLVAIGLLMAAHQQAVAAPQDLSIVGFDDIDSTRYVTPALTTIRQPRLELGRRAMNMALDLLNGKEVQDQKLGCELVVRESTT